MICDTNRIQNLDHDPETPNIECVTDLNRNSVLEKLLDMAVQEDRDPHLNHVSDPDPDHRVQ